MVQDNQCSWWKRTKIRSCGEIALPFSGSSNMFLLIDKKWCYDPAYSSSVDSATLLMVPCQFKRNKSSVQTQFLAALIFCSFEWSFFLVAIIKNIWGKNNKLPILTNDTTYFQFADFCIFSLLHHFPSNGFYWNLCFRV